MANVTATPKPKVRIVRPGQYIGGSKVDKDPCPVCGSVVLTSFEPSGSSEGDVDPVGRCTRCDWGY